MLFELVVVIIFLVQSIDKWVNLMMLVLFVWYWMVWDYVQVDCIEFESFICFIGFYCNKVVFFIGLGQVLVEWFGGEVLVIMDKLVMLFGVGCKIVNVILGNVFGIFGIMVDIYFG